MTLPDLASWNALWASAADGFLAADGFAGIAHPIDERYMFLCGDTLWSDGRATRSSAMIYDPKHKRLTAGSGSWADFIAPLTDGTWHWHGDMVWDGPDVWTFALRTRAAEGGWGFQSVQRSIVQIAWPAWHDPVHVDTYAMPFANLIDWGASLVREGQWFYVYGVKSQPGWYGHDVYLARVRTGHLLDASYWRFYAGQNSSGSMMWSSRESEARVIIPHEKGPSGTFSSDVNGGGTFRLVSKMLGDFGSDVTVWTSSSPAGPFSTRTVATAPWTSEDQTYGAFAHPGLGLTRGGERLVSVNHNSAVSFATLFEQPHLYRPSWHEVVW